LEKKGVLIFGKSLSLAGIGACLKLEKGLNVEFVDPQDLHALQCLADMNLDTILFDSGNPPNDLDLRLLRKQPDLLLIGLDPSRDEVLILKGQSSRGMTTGESSKLISNQTEPNAMNGSYADG
jgi:hypothetical protein